jgi:hypothetical protein
VGDFIWWNIYFIFFFLFIFYLFLIFFDHTVTTNKPCWQA